MLLIRSPSLHVAPLIFLSCGFANPLCLVGSSNADQKQDDLRCLPKDGRLCDAQVEILDIGSRTANTPTIPSQKEYLYPHKSVQLNIQTVGIFGGLLGWLSMETVREHLDHEVHSSKRVKQSRPSFFWLDIIPLGGPQS
jgi:hypothetical protein